MENFFFAGYSLPSYTDLKLIFLFLDQTFVFLLNILLRRIPFNF